MPRILPRLIEKIKAQANSQKSFASPLLKRRNKPKSLYKPVPPSPSFKPADHPHASLLLAPQNPIVNSRDYVRHKTLPPRPSTIPKNAHKSDLPRQMTEKEFGWWANPYLRMLTSPLRKCAITGRHLPSDLLIRLVPVSVPASVLESKKTPSQSVTTLVPDGLLHPKYAARQRSGGAVYALCWRQIISQTQQKGFHNPSSPGSVAGPRIHEHIAHLLRLRVLQEFELLAEKLESRKNYGGSGVVLRTLTQEEWELVESTGTLPYDNAVAVFVVPQVVHDPDMKEMPPNNMSALPPDDEQYPTDCPPVCTLLPTRLHTWNGDLPNTFPTHNIPLYNAISAFPSRSQCATLHNLFTRILEAEISSKRVNSKQKSTTPSTNSEPDSTPSNASHAFLLCSDAYTAKRGDIAAVALALWRLRMYESEGWMDNGDPKVSR